MSIKMLSQIVLKMKSNQTTFDPCQVVFVFKVKGLGIYITSPKL
jgi:hypothetical protein